MNETEIILIFIIIVLVIVIILGITLTQENREIFSDQEFIQTFNELVIIGQSRTSPICPTASSLYGQVYVISLEKDLERRTVTHNILRSLGFSINHFSAVDKDKIEALGGKLGLKQRKILSSINHFKNFPEIGCALSHKSIWAMTLANNESYVTIFEDDVMSHIDQITLNTRVEEAMRLMDPDWDILYLGKCLDNCEKYIKVVQGLYRTNSPACLHAYIISNRAIRKLLREPLYKPIDWQLRSGILRQEIKAYVMHPSIFIQDVVNWSSNLQGFQTQLLNQVDCACDSRI